MASYVCSCALLTFSLSTLLLIPRTRFMNALEMRSKVKMHQSYSNLWYIGKVGSQFCGNMPQNCDLNTFFKSHLLSRSATVYLFILQQLFWLHLSAEKCQHSRTCVFSITVCFARLTPLWEYPLNHVLRRC